MRKISEDIISLYYLLIDSNDFNVSKDVWLNPTCRVCNRTIKRFALFVYVFVLL